MRGTIVLRLAISLDGYVADEAGGYDWIQEVPSPGLDTEHVVPFEEFLESVDTVVMGRRCYEQGQHEDYVASGMPVLVASTHPNPSTVTGVEFSADILGRVGQERDRGRRCYLFGGGRLASSFIEAGLVDELTVGVVPVLLGVGRPLFYPSARVTELRLVDYTVRHGQVRLTYRRRLPAASEGAVEDR